KAVGAIVMLERLFNVEQVDHEGRDGNDALVDGRSSPGGPTALRTAGDDKLVDIHVPAGGTVAKRRNGVHGAHSALGHGQAQRPLLVPGSHVLVPRVGNDGVFT